MGESPWLRIEYTATCRKFIVGCSQPTIGCRAPPTVHMYHFQSCWKLIVQNSGLILSAVHNQLFLARKQLLPALLWRNLRKLDSASCCTLWFLSLSCSRGSRCLAWATHSRLLLPVGWALLGPCSWGFSNGSCLIMTPFRTETDVWACWLISSNDFSPLSSCWSRLAGLLFAQINSCSWLARCWQDSGDSWLGGLRLLRTEALSWLASWRIEGAVCAATRWVMARSRRCQRCCSRSRRMCWRSAAWRCSFRRLSCSTRTSR